jgi:tRNA(Arg) A34 adenosine deaminase TadA
MHIKHLIFLSSCVLFQLVHSTTSPHHDQNQQPLSISLNKDPIPFETRAHWIHRANKALGELSPTPCPFDAFASVVINHTDTTSLGSLVCMGINAVSSGNPILHGEIAAINNCSSVLQGPGFNLSPADAALAFRSLSLYTNAEACVMCASAIRWAGFREYVFWTALGGLVGMGWSQFSIGSREVFERSKELPTEARFVGSVLANETDPYFAWQFDSRASCPPGCQRGDAGGCVAS